ncbi:PREDICTED: cell death activator CIDE-3-like [Thamnophis sirtalis]|uniref:Cell death activator CIDE-3-like n=1 Tax=Thamnophis sirtalis TaxID=35019 RepID=A0A6I9YYP0_9SAUR|nr:PREDICTED: cell death activator CIDE-3-like [Thamnophis sirtalis]
MACDITFLCRIVSPSSRCVSASASVTQQLLAGPAPRPRPYRVNNRERTLRKGIMAENLDDLLEKCKPSIWPSCSLTRSLSFSLSPISPGFPREALRWTLFTMQTTGHILLGTSCYMQQLLDTPEGQKEEALPSLFLPSIPLPSSLTRRMLQ